MEDTIYIIEGPDGSGKSTLSKYISDKLNIESHHLTYIRDEKEMFKQFAEADEMYSLKDESCIFDRYILSNLVYGIVFHNCDFVTGWTLFLNNLLSKVSVRHNVHLIFCLPEKKFWMEKFEKLCKERDEMYIDVEKMSKVYDMFLMFYIMISCNTNIRVTIIDPFVEDVEKIFNNEE